MIRELENIVERAFNMLDDTEIQLKHLPYYLQIFAGHHTRPCIEGSLKLIINNVEKEALMLVLETSGE